MFTVSSDYDQELEAYVGVIRYDAEEVWRGQPQGNAAEAMREAHDRLIERIRQWLN